MVVGLMGLLAMSVSGVRAQATKTERIEPNSISPFSIARAIKQNPSSNIIEVDLSHTWKKLGIDSGQFDICTGNCDVNLYQHELDGHREREVILKLSLQWTTVRYLIFRKPHFRNQGWKLLGHIDHDFNRYQMARHRVVRALGKPWLVVRGQEGSGSGYSLYGETWYEVTGSGVVPVLHYSQEGHTYSGPGGLNWEFRAQPVASTVGRARRPAIRLNFVARFTATGFTDSEFTHSFVNRRQASYVWSKQRRAFVFASGYSTISEGEMEAIANVETEPPEDDQGTTIAGNTFYSSVKGFVGKGFEIFVRLNAKRLHAVARNTGSPGQQWLHGFLKQCDNIPEKLALERALRDRLPQSQKQR